MLKSRLSTNTIALLISNGGTAILVFLLSVLIGRELGETALGVYATALAWIFPITLIADFGVGTLITRDIAQSPEHTTQYVHQSTIARLFIGISLLIMMLLFAPLINNDKQVIQGIQLSAPLIIIMPFFGMFTAVFRAYRIMYPISILNIGMLVFQLPLTAWVFASGGDISSALAINTLTSLGQLLCAWWFYRRLIKPFDIKITIDNRNEVYQLLKRAYPFAVAGVLSAIQLRVGIILLEQLSDAGEVGYYSVASRFTEAVRMLPNALFGALLPTLSASIAKNDNFRQLFRRVILIIIVFSIMSAIMLTLTGEWLIKTSYGDNFTSAVPILIITSWALLPSLLKSTRILYWYAYGREQFVNWVTGITVIVQIVLSLWLIPQYNAIGLGVVLLITEILGLILLMRPYKQAQKV